MNQNPYLQELSARDEIFISFVCLGNICRSPMAAAIFSNRTKDLSGPRAIVESGGTSSWHIGQDAHPQSRKTWESAGYNYSHRASQFSALDLERLDLVLTMDSENFANVTALATSDADLQKIFLMRDFDNSIPSGASVPDPYSQEDAAYEHVRELLESAVDGLIATLWP
ncbi:MAG: low molecular weight phosphotyrosine protein phosphatase [Actinobacteria bacterium]|nr:low molecular weight phosphotyrosine protein phosphatase [Actinomycetota bacterium]